MDYMAWDALLCPASWGAGAENMQVLARRPLMES